jgi:hypothetical protein
MVPELAGYGALTGAVFWVPAFAGKSPPTER